MQRVILFSQPGEVMDEIVPRLFPKELSNKVFAYIPSDGDESPNEALVTDLVAENSK